MFNYLLLFCLNTICIHTLFIPEVMYWKVHNISKLIIPRIRKILCNFFETNIILKSISNEKYVYWTTYIRLFFRLKKNIIKSYEFRHLFNTKYDKVENHYICETEKCNVYVLLYLFIFLNVLKQLQDASFKTVLGVKCSFGIYFLFS